MGMKRILENWRQYAGDTSRIYHYSDADEDSIVLDPQRFLTHRNPYTKREYATSAYPRSFFYTDLSTAEKQIASGRKLYYADVPSQQIYDIVGDPERLKEKSKGPYGLALNFDELFQNIIGRGYKGASYNIGAETGVVVWLEPIKVTRMEIA
jgi:hypothetical protein